MFHVHLIKKNLSIPKDDICYLIGENGKKYLKKKTGIIDSLVEVDSVPGLEKIEEYATIDIPKINIWVVSEVICFLKKMYEFHKSEGTVVLFYNEKEKTFNIGFPKQGNSPTSSLYKNGNLITPDGYIRVGTFHSHSDFGAFHSGTDHKDESEFDGLHITIGHVNTELYSISASIVINKKRFMLDPLDYMEGITKVNPVLDYSNIPEYINAFILSNKNTTDKNVKQVIEHLQKTFKPIEKDRGGYKFNGKLNVKKFNKAFIDKYYEETKWNGWGRGETNAWSAKTGHWEGNRFVPYSKRATDLKEKNQKIINTVMKEEYNEGIVSINTNMDADRLAFTQLTTDDFLNSSPETDIQSFQKMAEKLKTGIEDTYTCDYCEHRDDKHALEMLKQGDGSLGIDEEEATEYIEDLMCTTCLHISKKLNTFPDSNEMGEIFVVDNYTPVYDNKELVLDEDSDAYLNVKDFTKNPCLIG